MATDPHQALADLVHDVNAQCTNLKRAAAVLRGEPTAEELEYLRLMVEQSRSLADGIAAYEGGILAKKKSG